MYRFAFLKLKSDLTDAASVLMISASINMLTSILQPVEGGTICFSPRYVVRLFFALVSLGGGTSAFILGRKVKIVEDYVTERTRRARPQTFITNEDFKAAFEANDISSHVVALLLIVATAGLAMSLILLVMCLIGIP